MYTLAQLLAILTASLVLGFVIGAVVGEVITQKKYEETIDALILSGSTDNDPMLRDLDRDLADARDTLLLTIEKNRRDSRRNQ